MIVHSSKAAQILQNLFRIKVKIQVVVVNGSVEQIGKLCIVHSLTVLGVAVEFRERIEATREET